MTPGRVTAGVVALLSTLTLVSACTATHTAVPRSGTRSTAGSPPVTPSAAASPFPSAVDDGITLAIDTYAPDAARTAYILWAAEVETATCVRGLGYDVPQPKVPTAAVIGSTHGRRYGVTSPQDAAAFGYHLASEIEPPTTDPYRSVPDAALNGGTAVLNRHPVPAGGCRGQTTRTFDEDASASGRALASAIDANSYVASQGDPRLDPVFAEWAQCMRTAGFDYSSPVAAANAADLNTSTPSAVEIATATADVACKTSTDLDARWSAIESDLEAGPIAAGRAQLLAYQAVLAATLQTAQRITSVAPPI